MLVVRPGDVSDSLDLTLIDWPATLGRTGKRSCTPIQRERLDQAIGVGQFRIETLTETDDLAEYADLRRILGRGEAACIVLAKRNGWLVASDEKGRFRREALARVGPTLVNTAGLLVTAIRAGLISVEEADTAKTTLEQRRFRLSFASFRDIL